MPHENVEVVHEAARLFEAGDWDGFGALFTEDARFEVAENWPEPGPFVGRTAIADEFKRLQESWGANQVVIEDVSGPGDRLVVRFRWVVKGAGSGVPGEMTIFVALRFDDGRIAEYRAFWDRAKALAAAGLED